MTAATHSTVSVWAGATPDEISKRFLNMLVKDADLGYRLSRLFGLFAPAPPVLTGTYCHHDGYRS